MTITCNSCGATDYELLFSNHKSPNIRFAAAPRDVCICRACGLVFLDITELSQQDLADYYTTFNTFVRPGPLAPGQILRREGQVEWVFKRLPADHDIKTAVEVGHGSGYVLKLLQDKGLNVWGVDYSQAMHDSMKELYGIDGYVGAFSPDIIEKEYDLLVNIQTLEHMMDPNETLAGFSQALAAGGYAFIEVPDSEYPRWDCLPDYFTFDHLYHFTGQSLGRMLEQNGFEIIASEHIDNPKDSGNPFTVLRMLARKTKSPAAQYSSINDYRHQKDVMISYRENFEDYLEGFSRKINAIKARVGNEKMAIHCAGEHTALLLDRIDLSGFNIPCIFDGDPATNGKDIMGIPVRHSSEIANSGFGHFLMSTTNHENEICSALKKAVPGCHVYGLYEEFD